MNSYISIEEAEVIISNLFTSNELEMSGWSTLGVDDKQVLLNKATLEVDKLVFIGKKKEISQLNKFPRIIKGVDTGIPEKLKYSIAHLVILTLLNKDNTRYKLQEQNVKSISISGVSESFIEKPKTLLDTVIELYLGSFIFKGVLGE